MIRLSEKEFGKIADITGVPDYELQKLHAMGLLKDSNCIKLLIKRDYRFWIRRRMFRPNIIISKLMDYYGVSQATVLDALDMKKGRQRYCEECNHPIDTITYNRNLGLCDDCMKKQIEI